MRVPGWAQYLLVLGAAFAVGSLAGNVRSALAPSPARPDRPAEADPRPPGPPPAAPPQAAAPAPAPVPPATPWPSPPAALPRDAAPAGRTQTPGGDLPRRPAPSPGAPSRAPAPVPSRAPATAPARALAVAPSPASAANPGPTPPFPAGRTPGASDRERLRALASLRNQLPRLLPAFQERLAPCAGTGPGGGPLRLVLQLESLDGEVRIADAVPDGPAAAADPRAGCATRALRGATFASPATLGGASFMLPFELQPR